MELKKDNIMEETLEDMEMSFETRRCPSPPGSMVW